MTTETHDRQGTEAFDQRRAGLLSAVSRAASDANRRVEDIRVIAVSKTFPMEAINGTIASGQADFGENRIAEAESKGWPALLSAGQGKEARPTLHLIGPLQTNKVRRALELFDWIHTLDRPSLAQALSRLRSGLPDGQPFPKLLVQINTGCEPQKGGVPPHQADAFIRACTEDWNLKVSGLMCIPPKSDIPAPHFALVRKLAERHGLPELSMGMSADFSEAIRQGATCIRVGTALFGPRTVKIQGDKGDQGDQGDQGDRDG